jgi:mono/diheme cytochrome c family protein
LASIDVPIDLPLSSLNDHPTVVRNLFLKAGECESRRSWQTNHKEINMSNKKFTRTFLLAGLALLSTAVVAQGRVDVGKREYDNNCAVCHGSNGKGGGPYVELLKRSPPDLTTLAKSNGGIFPVNRSFEVIEGAGAGHGTRDMPIWGQAYSVKAAEYYVDMPYNQEAFMRSRILALIEYINRLQVK